MRIEISTEIAAPVERVFDLARSIDLHLAGSRDAGERAIAGRKTGLIELGESVTWSARHLGLRWEATSKIVAFDRPRSFVDEMTKGPFALFHHEHEFVATAKGTTMLDRLDVESPLGPLGRVATRLVVGPHLRGLLVERAADIRRAAESDGWRAYLRA